MSPAAPIYLPLPIFHDDLGPKALFERAGGAIVLFRPIWASRLFLEKEPQGLFHPMEGTRLAAFGPLPDPEKPLSLFEEIWIESETFGPTQMPQILRNPDQYYFSLGFFWETIRGFDFEHSPIDLAVTRKAYENRSTITEHADADLLTNHFVNQGARVFLSLRAENERRHLLASLPACAQKEQEDGKEGERAKSL